MELLYVLIYRPLLTNNIKIFSELWRICYTGNSGNEQLLNKLAST